MGKILIFAGIVLILAGILLQYGPRLPFPWKLPGDIVIERGNFKMYFPIMTSLLISVILSLIVFLISRSKQ